MTGIPSWAVVGAKVTLKKPINSYAVEYAAEDGMRLAEFGFVYTIREICIDCRDYFDVGIRLQEIINKVPRHCNAEVSTNLDCFRPVISKPEQVERDVAKFTHLLVGTDAKIVEPA